MPLFNFDMTTFVMVAAFCVLTYIAYHIFFISLPQSRRIRKFPPGPGPLPLVGNVKDLPPEGALEWKHWAKHKDVYGPISSVTAVGTTIVIISDYDVAVELLEKRGNSHSGRPQQVFFGEMVGWAQHTGFLRYNDELRYQRKQIHAIIGTPSAAAQFASLQNVESHRFLLRVLQKPDDLLRHCRVLTSAVLLKMLYGYTVEPKKADPLIDAAEVVMTEFSWAAKPGTWLVDLIPAIKRLPDWFPGTEFKQIAKQMHRRMLALSSVPIQFVQAQRTAKTHSVSFASTWIERVGDIAGKEDESLRASAMSLYAGGSDTTTATIQVLFLALALHPEVQRKAQQEIDSAIGSHRLPNAEDRPALPYIEAVMKEAARWHPIAPMGLPHESAEDDMYEGYLIPKGAILMPNIWLFAHDPKIHPEPHIFKPERFLGEKAAPDPKAYQFGFGRRRCPALVFADTMVWLTVARSLAVFNIGKATSPSGKALDLDQLFEPGIVSHPKAFEAEVSARSMEHRQLIEDVETLHPWEESHAGDLEGLL